MASGMAAALSTLTRWIAAVGTFAIGRKQSSIQVVESTLVRDASWYSDCQGDKSAFSQCSVFSASYVVLIFQHLWSIDSCTHYCSYDAANDCFYCSNAHDAPQYFLSKVHSALIQ